jgi:hypothetical protein
MKSQSVEDEFDPLELIKRFNRGDVRYLLIGSMALAMYDSPVGSADYDFWIAGEDRVKTYEILDGFGLQGEHDKDTTEPLDTFSDGELLKIDVFFVKVFSNEMKGITIPFKDVYGRSIVRKDPQGDFLVRVPTLDDLILMKKVVEDPRPQYQKHIEYLEAIREQQKK